MNARQWFPASLAALLVNALLIAGAAAATNDREYNMGDDGDSPAASAGSTVGTTFDNAGQLGMNQLHDLLAVGGPVYTTVSGRPDGGTGLAIEFNGSNQYLRSSRFGLPDTTVSSIGSGLPDRTLNYLGITDRGLQFWVKPASTGVQSLVMDTNQHGVRINADGNYSMRYNGDDFASTEAATIGQWQHIMVVRPNGAANGSRMYVDGIAVAAAPGGYDGGDTADLVVGANTAGDDGGAGGVGFTGGTEEFFSGVIDELTLFLIGDNSDDPGPPPGQDWGDFDFGVDNAFAAFTLSGVAGDIDNNGTFEEQDKNDFIAGWQSENLVDGIRVGDLTSFAAGDLNFDGITDIRDLARIQTLLPLAGLSAITSADLAGVPEPTALALTIAGLSLLLTGRRSR